MLDIKGKSNWIYNMQLLQRSIADTIYKEMNVNGYRTSPTIPNKIFGKNLPKIQPNWDIPFFFNTPTAPPPLASRQHGGADSETLVFCHRHLRTLHARGSKFSRNLYKNIPTGLMPAQGAYNLVE